MTTGTGDVRLERTVGKILRVGVAACTVCLALGLLLSSVGQRSNLGHALITVGLWILMGTPVARVAASVAEFAAERDWRFVILSSVVLLEICGSIVAALFFRRHA
jgi:uncharacterized membrane protein